MTSPSGRPAVTPSRIARTLVPGVLLVASAKARGRARFMVLVSLLVMWVGAHFRYRAWAKTRTETDFNRLLPLTRDVYTRHYNERVPTVLEERGTFVAELYFQRHLRRYALVAEAVAAAVDRGVGSAERPTRILDLGSGAALLAEPLDAALGTRPYDYVAFDFTAHHTGSALAQLASLAASSHVARGEAERLPFADEAFDVVVISEVIEHLMRPEDAMWEISRVLRVGGTMVLTTDNASEMPERSVLSHPLLWVEHAMAATSPGILTNRTWAWIDPLHPEIHPTIPAPVYAPHTHHLRAELEHLAHEAGLQADRWLSFEFLGHQTLVAQVLQRAGKPGIVADALLNWLIGTVPGLRRMGVRQMLVATKTSSPASPTPTAGAWHGPWSAVPRP